MSCNPIAREILLNDINSDKTFESDFPAGRSNSDLILIPVNFNIGIPETDRMTNFIFVKSSAICFLCVLMLSLSSSFVMEMSRPALESCCSESSGDMTCEKTRKQDKIPCDRDHCSPFLTCSNTPIILAERFSAAIGVSTIREQYPPHRFYVVAGAHDSFWHPPES
jgi:hypothetical protein